MSRSVAELAQIIRNAYPVWEVGYDEDNEILAPSGGYFSRLWNALLGRPTHELREVPGACRFTIIHHGGLDEKLQAQTLELIEDQSDLGIDVTIRWATYVAPLHTSLASVR